MYILELFTKVLKTLCRGKTPVEDTEDDTIEYEKCDHIFAPVDSTETVLACTKCGQLVRKDELVVKDNIFKNCMKKN